MAINPHTLERYVLNLKGSDWQKLDLRQRERVVEDCFQYWRARGFPYYDLNNLEKLREYRRIEGVRKEEILLGNEIQMSMSGIKLANFFHPQMWSVQVTGAHSPFERFNSDENLRKLIRKALTIWPDRCAANESNLRRMLKTFSNTAGVSNFRPTAAKAIYEKYSRDNDCVLDFSAGYGGRLLGCLPLKRHYIGVDPCTDQVRGLKRMLKELKKLVEPKAKVSIYQACAEDFLPTIKSRSVSLVFSSPPYFNQERYSNEPSQSYLRYPTYELWLEGFLKTVIAECWRILKPKGYLLINMADINGYKLITDTRRMASDFFRLKDTLMLRLGNKPYLRNRTGQCFKYEPILVFRKAQQR
jgi:SAM-dependent methyltransferase